MYFEFRRVLDGFIAAVALILLSPLMLGIAVAIKLDSKGPVIFRQKRYGKDFIPYEIYKFRSMIVNAQNIGTGVYSFEGDPRITKVGHFLRKTSLDELPQLWNILKGDMAFVGPRSPVVGFFPKYEELNNAYKRRFTVLPGLTGLAQIKGRNDLSWDEKVRYDNIYITKVKKFGLLYDIKIWILTFFTVFLMKDVAEKHENFEKNISSFNKNRGDKQ